MAKLNKSDTSIFKDWQDGTGNIMTANDYKREREAIITAINDNDDQISKAQLKVGASINDASNSSTTETWSANKIHGQVGDLAALQTTDKTNVVAAINEIKATGGGSGVGIDDTSTTSTVTTLSANKINTQLATKANTSHNHSSSDITQDSNHQFVTDTDKTNWNNKGDMLKSTYDTTNNGKVDAAENADSVPWTGVTGKPTTFTPSAHSHAITDVTNLQTTLDGKAASTHTHAAADITQDATHRFVTDSQISTWNSGTGGTTANSSIIYATDKGAIGDGLTDDTLTIQTALNNLLPYSTFVFDPGKEFLINSTLTISVVGVTLKGSGRLKCGLGNGDTAQTFDFIPWMMKVTAEHVTLDGLNFENPSNYVATGAVLFQALHGTAVNCRVDNYTNGLFSDRQKDGFKALGNTVTNVVGVASENIGDGIVAFGPYSTITGNEVTCKTGTDARVGIVADLNAQYSVISSNTITGPFRRSIHVELSDNCTVEANTCVGATTFGIITVSNGVAMEGNIVECATVATPWTGQPQAGIYVPSGGYHSCSVIGNTIMGKGRGKGIDLRGTLHSAIGNNIQGNSASALTNAIFVQGSNHSVLQNTIDAVCSDRSIYAYQCDHVKINDNTVIGGLHGIDLVTCKYATVGSNYVANTKNYGIVFENVSDYGCATGNTCTDTQTTKTQLNGIFVNGSLNVLVASNQLSNNSSAGFNYIGTCTGTRVVNNLGASDATLA